MTLSAMGPVQRTEAKGKYHLAYLSTDNYVDEDSQIRNKHFQLSATGIIINICGDRLSRIS